MPHFRRNAAYYAASTEHFATSTDDEIYAALTQPAGFTLDPEQLIAWKSQLPIVRQAIEGVPGWIHLEFDIPRLGRRVDAVLVSGPAVISIEFKVGSRQYLRSDYEQAWDYGLDLKNFHAPSHSAPIFTVLCATTAPQSDTHWEVPHHDGVYPPFSCNSEGLKTAIRLALAQARGPQLDVTLWGEGKYSPTPTIIEAARSLYSRHTVQDITRSDAGATNLGATVSAVEEVIEDAKTRCRKAAIFITGVPGAGKTLAGLSVATRHGAQHDTAHAVYLSGNGPLVEVLREALARDDYARQLAEDHRARIGTSRNAVKAFIQNVHHFRDDTLRSGSSPSDHIVVFDEAQRAWNAHMLGRFMRRKRGKLGFSQSEPDLLISAMDRHQDWAVIVCLVGEGQEINTGEAGVSAWLESLCKSYPGWDVHLSPCLDNYPGETRDLLAALQSTRSSQSQMVNCPALHLSTSLRSFRAETVSDFVRALLDNEAEACADLFSQIRERYPIVVSRSMKAARHWVRSRRRGSERAGLVASSSAQRLKPHAVDVRVNVNPVHWFLGPDQDTRSSQYLEDAATEFQVQGLELDWTIVAWDADLRRNRDDWSYHSFRGAKWTSIKQPERCKYLKNAYRVLLTRARQGMVLFVPPGRRRDATRDPGFYDGIFKYLRQVGVPEI